ncbi:Peptidase family C54, partial [Rhizoctonia solani]
MPPQMPTSPSSQKLHRMIRRQENQPGPEGSSRSRRGARRSSPSVGDSGSGSGPSIAVAEEGAADAELSRSPSSVSQAMAMAVATRARQSESAVVPSPSSTSVRLGDISTRLSGWFSHLTGSTTDLGMTNSLSNAATMVPASPKRAQPRTDGPMSNVARPVKGGIDKVMRYLTDSDATPDGCTDPIWILGVLHAGFEPPDPSASPPPQPTSPHRRDSTESSLHVQLHRKARNPPGAFTHHQNPSLQSVSSFTIESGGPSKYAHAWPPVFYEDFTSLIWLTYRSHYTPIRDTSLESLAPLGPCDMEMAPAHLVPASPRRWNWPGSADKSWTSDAGWGCMLRTGQSLLANALIHLHLGRNWRRPHYPMFAEEHAVYVKILTWFFDTPSPLAPFGVHRMALAGKALGKDVGTWFGPSTAAGSIKTLAHAFPECQLSVSLAVDGTVFASDVYAASHMGMVTTSGRSISSRRSASKWGGRAVLILVNIRLGLDNVNPIYYDALKSLFQFPQSVGISGGRPSSSYYFVGSQADSLFYLDPHHTRPYIPLRPPPSVAPEPSDTEDSIPEETSDVPATPNAKLQPRRDITPDPHPTPRPRVSSPASPASSDVGHHRARSSFSPPRSMPNYQLPSASSSSKLAPLIPGGIDSPDGIHYCCAYSAAELRTFHCDRVRKMPMSALDPSMLLGFLCRDDADWKDFRTRVADVSLRETVPGGFANLWQMSKKTKTLFSIADEPPSWSDIDSDDMGLESVSEPDMDSVPDHDDAEDFYDTHTGETRSAILGRAETSPPGELSTTDESMEVVTPGPRHSARFDTMRPAKDKLTHHSRAASSEGGDDDWVDPAPPPSDVSQIPGVENGAPASISATPSPDLVPSPSVPSVVSEGSSLPESPVRRGGKFPFPAGDDDEEELIMQYPKAQSTRGSTQLRTVRARDGGRTKSGGVRGLVEKDEA